MDAQLNNASQAGTVSGTCVVKGARYKDSTPLFIVQLSLHICIAGIACDFARKHGARSAATPYHLWEVMLFQIVETMSMSTGHQAHQKQLMMINQSFSLSYTIKRYATSRCIPIFPCSHALMLALVLALILALIPIRRPFACLDHGS